MVYVSEATRMRRMVEHIREEGALASREEVIAVACPACGVAPGEQCKRARNSFFLLGIVFSDLGRIHVRRYQSASGDTR